MKLPDGSTLMHAGAPYDPNKAHEYYLKTRKLKGRKAGSKPTVSTEGFNPTHTFSVKTSSGKTAKLTSQQLTEQRAYAAERVASIKKKLTQLNAILKTKIAEAKKAEAEAKKPDSAAEKSKAAKDSKQYRDKHAQEISNKGKKASEAKKDSKPSATDQVASLKKTIDGVQKSLKAAVDRQRSLTAATKNG